MGLPVKNMGIHVPLKNIVKIKAPAPKNSIYVFCSTPKAILNFNNLPLKNSMVPQPGVGGGGELVRVLDVRCNSPVWLVGATQQDSGSQNNV